MVIRENLVPPSHSDTVSEWLRRWTRNPLGSARRGSNPLGVALTILLVITAWEISVDLFGTNFATGCSRGLYALCGQKKNRLICDTILEI